MDVASLSGRLGGDDRRAPQPTAGVVFGLARVGPQLVQASEGEDAPAGGVDVVGLFADFAFDLGRLPFVVAGGRNDDPAFGERCTPGWLAVQGLRASVDQPGADLRVLRQEGTIPISNPRDQITTLESPVGTSRMVGALPRGSLRGAAPAVLQQDRQAARDEPDWYGVQGEHDDGPPDGRVVDVEREHPDGQLSQRRGHRRTASRRIAQRPRSVQCLAA